MGKMTGFMEYDRVDGPVVSEEDRILNFLEFHSLLSPEEQQKVILFTQEFHLSLHFIRTAMLAGVL